MRIVNKSAPRNYKILEKIEAGITLLGSEVKAVRGGHVNLDGAHVRIMNQEAYLVNAKIYPYKYSRVDNYDESRSRKLLLHKKEITALKSRLDQGNFTLIPLALYTKNNRIKLEVALVQGKKQFEKRRELRKKVMDRDIERELKKWT